ncbi:hypothetical protein ARMSODRAFT_522267 [Armillaria solidipes]|uniref:Uncharacterized protein n=1 Tax=Armillaria solidipes TaxID=1076256 RepID=A0A2H3B522_9AGAR|nr:hypothetical protein ARMSODRAFT_522267 [Armillaria solidipes]
MAAKLALQMVAAKAEYGIFFAGYISIAAQLVRSADSSRPGRILLLSLVFKLQSESLPYYSCPLTQFQANIPTEPFLAILVAMLANLLPGRSVWRPPTDLLLEVPDGDEEEDGSDREEYTDSDAGDEDDIPRLSLQVATNAMSLQHPFLRSRDINRISVDHNTLLDGQNILAASTEHSGLHRQSFVHLCRSAPHVPSINVDSVTLVEPIQQSRWSGVWRCRINDEEKMPIMKFVS